MTPKLKVGDQVKYRSIGGNIVIAEVVELTATRFITKAITIDGKPPNGLIVKQPHDLDLWSSNAFKLLRHRVRIIDHQSHYTTELVEVWK